MTGLTGPSELGHEFCVPHCVCWSLSRLVGVLEAANCSNASELPSLTAVTKDLDLVSVSNFTPSLRRAIRSPGFDHQVQFRLHNPEPGVARLRKSQL